MNNTSISPKLLHKSEVDDVLLSNPKRVLPSRFSLSENQQTLSGCEVITALYEADAEQNQVLRFPSNDGVVTGLPFAAVMEINDSPFSRAVPHQVIDKMGGGEDIAMSEVLNDDNISAFLRQNKLPNRSSSFSFVNTGEHYFFYRKPHEHVPGIMLLEAARQAIYYQLYTYSGHELGKVTVSLRELNATFYAYAELMHPIEIIVDDLTVGEDAFPKEVHYSVSFYQRGSLIARIDSLAPVISLNRFKTARNACLFNEERFVPLRNAPLVSLITSSNRAPLAISLYEIGKNTAVTSVPLLDDLSHAFLTLVYGQNLFFHVPISMVSNNNRDVTWQFGDVAYAEMDHLKEMIKRGFVISKNNQLQA